MYEIFYDMLGVNKSLFITVNYYSNIPLLANILAAISSVFFIANFAVLYVLACIYCYFKAKRSTNPEAYFISTYCELVRVGICYALFGIVFAALKFSVNLPRPFCSLNPADFITLADISAQRCLSSFPSAHTGLSVLGAYIIWSHYGVKTRILSVFVVMIVAISRITLAMHYPADTLYSIIITVIIIVVSNFLYKALKDLLIIPIGNIIFKYLFRKN